MKLEITAFLLLALASPVSSAEVTGRIFDHCEQKPLTLVKVQLKKGAVVVQETGVNADGLFRFSSVAAGDYVVEVGKEYYVFLPTRKETTVGKDDITSDLGIITLYSPGCLASLKNEDFMALLTRLSEQPEMSRENLVANFQLFQMAGAQHLDPYDPATALQEHVIKEKERALATRDSSPPPDSL